MPRHDGVHSIAIHIVLDRDPKNTIYKNAIKAVLDGKLYLNLYTTVDVKNRLRAENPELNDAKYWRREYIKVAARDAARDGRSSKKQKMDWMI